jgi:hypothetical protein
MDTIEKWVREQLEEGYTPEQIKISLQGAGYNPSIVDEILNIKQRRNDSHTFTSIHLPFRKMA